MSDIFEPLDDDELDWLDDFLYHRVDDDADFEGKDEGVLNVSDLDGFLTAVVSGPRTIPPSEWMPQVWGDFPPAWKDEKAFEKVMHLLMRHMNSIAALLIEQPEDFEPIFSEDFAEGETYIIVDDWCEGYMRGVALAAEDWEKETAAMTILLAPVMAFQGENAFTTYEKFSGEVIDNLQYAITPNVREIHDFWLARRTGEEPAALFSSDQPKTGRNDPCPCGSGKKFKQCCLH